jgi:hypothetical protein
VLVGGWACEGALNGFGEEQIGEGVGDVRRGATLAAGPQTAGGET